MRLSHVAPAALPFVLLLALLATLVLSPRLHSSPKPHASTRATADHIPTLATVRVTAPASLMVGGNVASPLAFASMTGATVRSSWPWMRSELWMPYFSFAAPRADRTGF